MDEQASFEPQAVLGRRRTGWNRVLVLLPLIAFAIVAWAGLSGPRSASGQTARSAATPAAAQTPPPPAGSAPALMVADYPSRVLGIEVHGLADFAHLDLQPDDEIAVAGWYFTTSISDCPPFPAIYRDGTLPQLRPELDAAALCRRSGVLYASRPDLSDLVPANNLADNRSNSRGLPAVAATLAAGIVAPPDLDVVGSEAMPVVLLGRFIESDDRCGPPGGCKRELAIDHVAWAAGKSTELVIGDAPAATPGLPRSPADGVNVLDGASPTN